jgi:spore coat polysaccharide biosynthesis protein SpsF
MYIAIIQARMGSSRLPKKVLADIKGKPMLLHLIKRLKQSKKIERIVIATSTNQGDDNIESFAKKNSIDYFRGSEDDLLDRFYQAAKKFKADHIVRIWGDCVLIDPKVVDDVINIYEKDKLDYCSNVRPATFPRGNDVEVFSFKALEKTWKENNDKFYREYMTDYIFRNPQIFKLGNLKYKKDLSKINWCVDYPEDLAFAKAVIEHFDVNSFSFEDVLSYMEDNPDIAGINKGKERYTDYKAELKKKGLNNPEEKIGKTKI